MRAAARDVSLAAVNRSFAAEAEAISGYVWVAEAESALPKSAAAISASFQFRLLGIENSVTYRPYRLQPR